MQTPDQKLLNLSSYPDYGEVVIPSAGTKIVLSVYSADSSAPCILFVPGTMAHPLFYDDFLGKMAGEGFNVIGIHLLSHGKSPRERKTYTLSDMIENIRDTISYCREVFNDRIVLMGSSQGGMLCTAAAAEDGRAGAVFAHNMFFPKLESSISITRFPAFMGRFQKAITALMQIGARLFPAMPVPIQAYLEMDRITNSREIRDRFFQDPIGRTTYPLSFMASMFSADLAGVTNGSIKCPVIVIASTGDALFSVDYMKTVYDLIRAPAKEMMVFEENCHMIFHEAIDRVTVPIADKIKSCV